MGFKTLNQVDVTDGTVKLVDGRYVELYFSPEQYHITNGIS